MYDKYRERGFTVLAFPCGQFQQEFGSAEEIKNFVDRKFAVTFPLLKSVYVNGPKAHPCWKFIRSYLRDSLGTAIRWNFTKFLINKQGLPVQRFDPRVMPTALEPEVVRLLEAD